MNKKRNSQIFDVVDSYNSITICQIFAVVDSYNSIYATLFERVQQEDSICEICRKEHNKSNAPSRHSLALKLKLSSTLERQEQTLRASKNVTLSQRSIII